MKKSYIGKAVVDSNGLDIGYVCDVDSDFLKIAQGPFGEWLLLKKTFIGETGEKLILMDSLDNLLLSLPVFDSEGKEVGLIREVVASADVFDSIIVEQNNGNYVFIYLEDICKINGIVTLDVGIEDVLFGQESASHTLRESIKHWTKKTFSKKSF
ncbi:MAG: hypothetical protein AB1779_06995 [Candidatus Thermoplasmatota archaeon]